MFGYLVAVAAHLDNYGILARVVGFADLVQNDPLSGSLAIDAVPVTVPSVRWVATGLHWATDGGWSATLADVGTGRGAETTRYLPGGAVPAPGRVAAVLTALNCNPHTTQASATFNPPPRIDRRLLALRLLRYALPDPWSRRPGNSVHLAVSDVGP